MKMRPVGAELFYEDGQTDRRNEANKCFSQFFQHVQKYAILHRIRAFFISDIQRLTSRTTNWFTQPR
jgi:hypothetical protein